MIRCYFCKKAVADVPAAIDADWIPSFYLNQTDDDEVCTPVCPTCTRNHLSVDMGGCWYLRSRHADAEPIFVDDGYDWSRSSGL